MHWKPPPPPRRVHAGLTNQKLADQLAPLLDIPEAKAYKVVKAMFGCMVGALQNGQYVSVPGFGLLRPAWKKPVRRFDIAAGSGFRTLPAKSYVKFVPHWDLLERVFGPVDPVASDIGRYYKTRNRNDSE